jgi:hypothetical protein
MLCLDPHLSLQQANRPYARTRILGRLHRENRGSPAGGGWVPCISRLVRSRAAPFANPPPSEVQRWLDWHPSTRTPPLLTPCHASNRDTYCPTSLGLPPSWDGQRCCFRSYSFLPLLRPLLSFDGQPKVTHCLTLLPPGNTGSISDVGYLTNSLTTTTYIHTYFLRYQFLIYATINKAGALLVSRRIRRLAETRSDNRSSTWDLPV